MLRSQVVTCLPTCKALLKDFSTLDGCEYTCREGKTRLQSLLFVLDLSLVKLRGNISDPGIRSLVNHDTCVTCRLSDFSRRDNVSLERKDCYASMPRRVSTIHFDL